MKRIECNLPDSLYEALMERMQTDKTSCDHVVSTALSMSAGVKIGHRTPRERRFAAE